MAKERESFNPAKKIKPNNNKGVSKRALIPAMPMLTEQFVLLPGDTAIGYYFVTAELL